MVFFLSLYPSRVLSTLCHAFGLEKNLIAMKYLSENFPCYYMFSQGMEYLISNNLLNNTPEDIADFLFKEEGLNKTMIGNYLGEK